jgi:hypothetical protein
MFSKREGDEKLDSAGSAPAQPSAEQARLADDLVARGLDAETAAAVAANPIEALPEIAALLVSLRRERDETADLARELRTDLQAAEAEIRRLEEQAATGPPPVESPGPDSALADAEGRHAETLSRLGQEHADELAALSKSHEEALAAKDAE